MTQTRVAVAGALGRMGRLACATIFAAPDLALAGGFARRPSPDLAREVGLDGTAGAVYDDPLEFVSATRPDVVVDFTVYPVSVDVARAAVDGGASPVVGATGWTPEDEAAFGALCDTRGRGAAIVPNFALGAVLMMRFAVEAAPYFPTVEIVELHHDRKRDRPSGTAALTARRIATATGRDAVPVHSVRLRGLVAHQEVLLGNDGELLTIRHDSLSRDSFAAGLLLAIRGVRALPGLAVGLESFLSPKEMQT